MSMTRGSQRLLSMMKPPSPAIGIDAIPHQAKPICLVLVGGNVLQSVDCAHMIVSHAGWMDLYLDACWMYVSLLCHMYEAHGVVTWSRVCIVVSSIFLLYGASSTRHFGFFLCES